MNAITDTLGTPAPQTEKADPAQVKNNAGGYTFGLDKWDRLNRFLILGTDGGTYYVGQRQLTLENIAVVNECLDGGPADVLRTVKTIVDISTAGRAARNDQAIFALAAACSHSRGRFVANLHIGDVCRTGTMLFQFCEYMKLIDPGRGWGRSLRTAVANVLLDMPVEKLALHAIKYRQRDGWTYRDVLRLAHPKTDDPARNAVFKFMVSGELDEHTPSIIQDHVYVQSLDSNHAVIQVAANSKLPWESIPDEHKTKDYWESAAYTMPLGALTRQLATFARQDLLTPLGATERLLQARLTDPQEIQRSRLHPMQILHASLVHQSGGRLGMSRGSGYQPNVNVVATLEEAYKLAFQNVIPAGKRMLLALDVSGSMGALVNGSEILSCRTASVAMAQITNATEPYTHMIAFSDETTALRGGRMGYDGLTPDKVLQLNITGGTRLSYAIRAVDGLPFSGTDCSLPMQYAMQKNLEVDCFVVFTDNETYAGSIHPHMALQQYRHKSGIDARMIVVGMTSTGFSIADPSDAGMLDVVGFDTSTPALIADFAAGRI